MLSSARELLSDFSSRFETIEKGLSGIFQEVQQGLTTYAISTRESINRYLDEFSMQLAQAASALAGSVEALQENVDSLNDMLERKPASPV